jgi:hypothetical protein
MLAVCPCLQLFSATELERLVCGNPFLDFEGLQKSARYEGGYSPGEHAPVAAAATAAAHLPALLAIQLMLLSCSAQHLAWQFSLSSPSCLAPLPGPLPCPCRAPRGPVAVAGGERADSRGAQAVPQVLHRLRPRTHRRAQQPALPHPGEGAGRGRGGQSCSNWNKSLLCLRGTAV